MPTIPFFKSSLLSVAAGFITTVASAQLTTTLDISSANTGWYDSGNTSFNGNFLVGTEPVFGSLVSYHNYFVFDRSALKDVKILKASLEIFLPTTINFGPTYGSSNPNDTGALFSLYKFDGSVSDLQDNLGGPATFADLGSDAGGSFGSTKVSAANSPLGGSVIVDLSAYFLSYINGLSGTFALGGALTDLDANAPVGDSEYEYMFGDTNDLPTAASLRLEFIAVPEPSTYGLMGAAGLLGLVAWRRRASRKV